MEKKRWRTRWRKMRWTHKENDKKGEEIKEETKKQGDEEKRRG